MRLALRRVGGGGRIGLRGVAFVHHHGGHLLSPAVIHFHFHGHLLLLGFLQAKPGSESPHPAMVSVEKSTRSPHCQAPTFLLAVEEAELDLLLALPLVVDAKLSVRCRALASCSSRARALAASNDPD